MAQSVIYAVKIAFTLLNEKSFKLRYTFFKFLAFTQRWRLTTLSHIFIFQYKSFVVDLFAESFDCNHISLQNQTLFIIISPFSFLQNSQFHLKMTFVVSETKTYQHDLDKSTNEIRGFIVSLIKFFAQNKTCDWPMIYQELNNMNSQVDILLEQIKLRQERLIINRENVRETFSIDDEDTESDYGPTLSNPFDFTPSSDEGSLPFDVEIKKNSEVLEEINKRLGNLKGNIGIDVVSNANAAQGLANMIGAFGNLKRAKNFSNLAGLFDLS